MNDLEAAVANRAAEPDHGEGIEQPCRSQIDPSEPVLGETHGDAVSVYYRDREGNRLEVFLGTSWYCEQPLREPIELDQSDEAILAQAEAIARSRPKFQSREQWQAEMSRRMGYTPAQG